MLFEFYQDFVRLFSRYQMCLTNMLCDIQPKSLRLVFNQEAVWKCCKRHFNAVIGEFKVQQLVCPRVK